MKRYKRKFLTGEELEMSFWKKLQQRAGWFFKAIIPFLENIICFIFFYRLNQYVAGSTYFSRLDFYLLYVLLFAIVHGQHQAIFSAALAMGGHFFSQAAGGGIRRNDGLHKLCVDHAAFYRGADSGLSAGQYQEPPG